MKISPALVGSREKLVECLRREREKERYIVKLSKRDCEMDFGTIVRDVQFKCWFRLGNCVRFEGKDVWKCITRIEKEWMRVSSKNDQSMSDG